MADFSTLTLAIIVLALAFDFINGFHDAANSIATIVATKVLKYWQAVCWAALFNFLAFFFISTGVAKMVGGGLIDLSFVTPQSIIAGLVGGIIWNLFTWWRGIPASSSHTLIGAYAGAVFAHVLMNGQSGQGVFMWEGWAKVFAFIFIAPMVGMLISYLLNKVIKDIQKKCDWKGKRFFKSAQLASSALLSFNHGGNDAQKTAGIIAAALLAGGHMSPDNFHIPNWVLLAAYITIALGTLAGGWRIVKTLGFKLAQLKPKDGFSAETGAALSIAVATYLHMPISTTLSTTGAIVGVGAANGHAEVKWKVFGRIAFTWVLTLPVSFALGAIAMVIATWVGI